MPKSRLSMLLSLGFHYPLVEINCFRHTYNTLRPHQALNDWTPRHVYLTSRESQ